MKKWPKVYCWPDSGGAFWYFKNSKDNGKFYNSEGKVRPAAYSPEHLDKYPYMARKATEEEFVLFLLETSNEKH